MGSPVWRTDHSLQVTLDECAGTIEICGYATIFAEYDAYGGPSTGAWIERIDRKALEKALADSPDIALRVNFDGAALASTKNGTLELSMDEVGLKVRAVISSKRGSKLFPTREMKWGLKDTDGYELAFSFIPTDEQWWPDPAQANGHKPYSCRTITALSLDGCDMAVVMKPEVSTNGHPEVVTNGNHHPA